jgi:hypothetical protein
MEDRIAKLPAPIRRIVQNEDSLLGFFVVWYLCLTVFPVGGFYLGTIASPASNAFGIRHYYDLHVADIHFGGWFALIGLGIGICFGIWITFVYPKVKESDALEDEATARRIHQLLSKHDIIATDSGQQPEHVEEHPEQA